MAFVLYDQRVPAGMGMTGCTRTRVNYKTRHEMPGESNSHSAEDMLRIAELRSIAEASPRCG